jgi:hypothetical protein
MTLTRHFYDLEEVHAALAYSTTRHDPVETVFWCQELILSGCASEALSTLVEAWLWQKGPFALSWIESAFDQLAGDELSSEDLLLAAYQLTTCPIRDHSLWNILVLLVQGKEPEPIRPHPSWKSPLSSEQYFLGAIKQGRAYEACWMSRHLPVARVCELLEREHPSLSRILGLLPQYDKLIGFRSPEYDMLFRFLAILSCCLSEPLLKISQKPLPLMQPSHTDTIQSWMIGRMAYRRYSVSVMCLYGRTQRGRIKWSQTTVGYLTPDHLKGCPFWEEAGTMDAAFYEQYFPDDIPDEWSKVEKEKSHGAGVLGPAESIRMAKWARLHLNGVARLAWSHRPLVRTFLEESSHSDCDPISFATLMGPPSSISPSLLVPVCRRLIL